MSAVSLSASDLAGAVFVVGMRAEARVARTLGRVVIGAEAAGVDAGRGGAALISFGVCAGLDPALVAGAIVVPERVLTLAGECFAADRALVAALGGANAGALLASDAIIGKRAEKARLFAATGAAALDMESGAVARAAVRCGIPFAVFRAVADPAARDLPPAAEAAFGAGGSIDYLRLIASLVANPGQIPALIALAREMRAAMRALHSATQAR